MLTSIVIATYNKLEYTQQCIQSIRDYTERGTYEIIVVDNHSTDGSVDWLLQQADIRTICNEQNLGFPKACNQGIEIAIGDNILLLNNDTVLTERWLEQLCYSLYSSDEVGAVGSVTNSCSYGQAIPVSYSTLAEMHSFASNYNRIDPSKWDERLKLIGYCMLIKKSVVDQIGMLDERFTPGNYEDDDYSLRIRLAGYKLLLCKDTFIHHYGSVSFREAPPEYLKLMHGNRMKFAEKWGFDPDEAFKIRGDLVPLIAYDSAAPIRVLEIGCRCGGNLLEIRNHYPNAELYGTESNEAMAETAQLGIKRVEMIGAKISEPFDIIIISENQMLSYSELVSWVHSLLKPKGTILAYISNALHYSNLKPLIRGEISTAQLRGMTLAQAQTLFESMFSKINVTGLSAPISEKDSLFIKQLAQTAELESTIAYEITEFIFQVNNDKADSVKPSNPISDVPVRSIKETINAILLQADLEESLLNLAIQDIDEIADIIAESGNDQQVELMNYLAIQFMERQDYRTALPYLQKAFEWAPGNEQTLFNLGLACYGLNQLDIALEWFEMLSDPSEQVQSWIEQINRELSTDVDYPKQVTFLLRRVEQEIDTDASLKATAELLESGQLTIEEIISITNASIVEKAKVLSIIAIECFNRGLLEYVIPFMEAALEREPSNPFTLYHLAVILEQVGERESALQYLERVLDKDPEVEELKLKLRGQQV